MNPLSAWLDTILEPLHGIRKAIGNVIATTIRWCINAIIIFLLLLAGWPRLAELLVTVITMIVMWIIFLLIGLLFLAWVNQEEVRALVAAGNLPIVGAAQKLGKELSTYQSTKTITQPAEIGGDNQKSIFPGRKPDFEHVLSVAKPRQIIIGWDGAKLVTLDLNRDPHIGFIGRTKSGKTSGGLRPAVIQLAETGTVVVIFDKTGKNYMPFPNHPNIYHVRYNNSTLVDMTKAVWNESKHRENLMASQKVRDMARLNPMLPPIMVVFDEFSNQYRELMTINKSACSKVTSHLVMLVSGGAEAWINMMVVAQRPTADFIDSGLRSQLVPLVFRTQSGRDAGQAEAQGAEQLEQGEFYAIGVSDKRLIGWNPSDTDIAKIIDAGRCKRIWDPPELVRVLTQLQPPEISLEVPHKDLERQPTTGWWLDHNIDLAQLMLNKKPSPVEGVTVGQVLALDNLKQRKMSKNHMCEQVFGSKWGSKETGTWGQLTRTIRFLEKQYGA